MKLSFAMIGHSIIGEILVIQKLELNIFQLFL